MLLDTADFAGTERHFQLAIDICDQVYPTHAAHCRGMLAVICADRGEFNQAQALLDQGESQVRNVDELELTSLLCRRVHVEMLAGNREAARVALAEAETFAAALPERPEAAPDSALDRELRKAREALGSP